jgi:hypothetical protein
MVPPVSEPTKSYWIEEANSPLRNFRSSDELPNETDTVVVGSATAAFWTSKVSSPWYDRLHRYLTLRSIQTMRRSNLTLRFWKREISAELLQVAMVSKSCCMLDTVEQSQVAN